MLGNLLLGRLADKRGNKLSLEISLMASVIAFALAIFMPSPTIYFVVFALVGVNAGSAIGSAMLIVWEFCDSTRVPTYSGLANTTRGIMSLIAPLIATQIASLGYGFLFSVSCALSLAGLLLLHFWVMEPRWQKNANIIKPQMDI
jgi:MFS family permease